MVDSNDYSKQRSILDNQEYTVGDKIPFSMILSNNLNSLTDMMKLDVYNNINCFNQYERGVRCLESLLIPYVDDSFLEEKKYFESTDPEDKVDKIQKLDNRRDECMKLLKRKRFIPIDDITETSYFIVRDIIQRIRDEYDAQIVCYGPRGTGKSTLVIELSRQIAEKMGLEFDVEKHLFTNSHDLRKYITEFNPQPGQPLIWDEATAGKGMGKRRAMTSENIEYSEVIEVIREKGLVIFYTTPDKDFGDSKTISMFSCSIETIRLDKLEKLSTVKYKFKKGQNWVYLNDPMGNRINRIIIPKAPQDMIRVYKKIKQKMMDDKVKLQVKNKPKKETADIESIKKIILANQSLYRNRQGFDKRIVYNKFKSEKITDTEAYVLCKELNVENG